MSSSSDTQPFAVLYIEEWLK